MGRKRLTKEEFITKAKAVHGDKCDYSLVEINGNNKTKVTIKCNTCGTVFEQRIDNHLHGQGCPECKKEKLSKLYAMAKDEFIKKANEKHGNKYDYSFVKITGNNKTKVKIKCNTCSVIFEQSIDGHLHGQGCPECARERNKKALTMTKEEFIKKAKVIHGDKYSYDSVEYKGWNKKVIIVCPKHGDFHMVPNNHTINKEGCPCCKASHLEAKTRVLLEQNNIKYKPQMKFPWLLSDKNYPMFLDFYLPEYNIVIECQGEQHYMKEEGGFFTKDNLNNIKQRDSLKYFLCKEHNIPIYYIRYDENVEERLNEILTKIKGVI